MLRVLWADIYLWRSNYQNKRIRHSSVFRKFIRSSHLHRSYFLNTEQPAMSYPGGGREVRGSHREKSSGLESTVNVDTVLNIASKLFEASMPIKGTAYNPFSGPKRRVQEKDRPKKKDVARKIEVTKPAVASAVDEPRSDPVDGPPTEEHVSSLPSASDTVDKTLVKDTGEDEEKEKVNLSSESERDIESEDAKAEDEKPGDAKPGDDKPGENEPGEDELREDEPEGSGDEGDGSGDDNEDYEEQEEESASAYYEEHEEDPGGFYEGPELEEHSAILRHCCAAISAAYSKDPEDFLSHPCDSSVRYQGSSSVRHNFHSVSYSRDHHLVSAAGPVNGVQTVVVAWRGSAKAADWADAAGTWPKVTAQGVVHGTWQERAAAPQLLEQLMFLMDDGWKVVLTGHSFGGALACLSLYELLVRYPSSEALLKNCCCVTFGMPQIGSSLLPHTAETRGLFWHYRSRADPIPELRAEDLSKYAFDFVKTIVGGWDLASAIQREAAKSSITAAAKQLIAEKKEKEKGTAGSKRGSKRGQLNRAVLGAPEPDPVGQVLYLDNARGWELQDAFTSHLWPRYAFLVVRLGGIRDSGAGKEGVFSLLPPLEETLYKGALEPELCSLIAHENGEVRLRGRNLCGFISLEPEGLVPLHRSECLTASATEIRWRKSLDTKESGELQCDVRSAFRRRPQMVPFFVESSALAVVQRRLFFRGFAGCGAAEPLHDFESEESKGVVADFFRDPNFGLHFDLVKLAREAVVNDPDDCLSWKVICMCEECPATSSDEWRTCSEPHCFSAKAFGTRWFLPCFFNGSSAMCKQCENALSYGRCGGIISNQNFIITTSEGVMTNMIDEWFGQRNVLCCCGNCSELRFIDQTELEMFHPRRCETCGKFGTPCMFLPIGIAMVGNSKKLQLRCPISSKPMQKSCAVCFLKNPGTRPENESRLSRKNSAGASLAADERKDDSDPKNDNSNARAPFGRKMPSFSSEWQDDGAEDKLDTACLEVAKDIPAFRLKLEKVVRHLCEKGSRVTNKSPSATPTPALELEACSLGGYSRAPQQVKKLEEPSKEQQPRTNPTFLEVVGRINELRQRDEETLVLIVEENHRCNGALLVNSLISSMSGEIVPLNGDKPPGPQSIRMDNSATCWQPVEARRPNSSSQLPVEELIRTHFRYRGVVTFARMRESDLGCEEGALESDIRRKNRRLRIAEMKRCADVVIQLVDWDRKAADDPLLERLIRLNAGHTQPVLTLLTGGSRRRDHYPMLLPTSGSELSDQKHAFSMSPLNELSVHDGPDQVKISRNLSEVVEWTHAWVAEAVRTRLQSCADAVPPALEVFALKPKPPGAMQRVKKSWAYRVGRAIASQIVWAVLLHAQRHPRQTLGALSAALSLISLLIWNALCGIPNNSAEKESLVVGIVSTITELFSE